MSHWTDKLPANACDEARNWARTQPSYAAAWRNCQRGDWMLWLIWILRTDRRKLVLCCCEIARQVLHLIPSDEERPRVCIEIAERWVRGDRGVGFRDVRYAANAAYAAYAAYASAYAANAAYAAYSAANAAAYASAYAANAAANVAYAADAANANAAAYAAYAAYAADAAADADAKCSDAKSADIVRKHYPRAPRLR